MRKHKGTQRLNSPCLFFRLLKIKTKINKMLSLSEFKNKLGDTNLNDKQLEDLLKSLYDFISPLIDELTVQKYGTN